MFACSAVAATPCFGTALASALHDASMHSMASYIFALRAGPKFTAWLLVSTLTDLCVPHPCHSAACTGQFVCAHGGMWSCIAILCIGTALLSTWQDASMLVVALDAARPLGQSLISSLRACS